MFRRSSGPPREGHTPRSHVGHIHTPRTSTTARPPVHRKKSNSCSMANIKAPGAPAPGTFLFTSEVGLRVMIGTRSVYCGGACVLFWGNLGWMEVNVTSESGALGPNLRSVLDLTDMETGHARLALLAWASRARKSRVCSAGRFCCTSAFYSSLVAFLLSFSSTGKSRHGQNKTAPHHRVHVGKKPLGPSHHASSTMCPAPDSRRNSQSVNEGHPDKICDQVSDAVLDACLKDDERSRVACETCTKTGMVMIFGEITTNSNVNYEQVIRDALKDIGYDDTAKGLDYKTCNVVVAVEEQSPDIAQSVDATRIEDIGAGDQGIMFGYATDETDSLMPLSHELSTQIGARLTEVRKKGICEWCRPDGKTQVRGDGGRDKWHHGKYT